MRCRRLAASPVHSTRVVCRLQRISGARCRRAILRRTAGSVGGREPRGADLIVDARLDAQDAPGQPWDAAGPAFEVIANSAQAAHVAAHPGAPYPGPHPIGARVPVQACGGALFVQIRDLPASEVLLLVNRGTAGGG